MKGTTCFRSFSIGNDLFTTLFTAQMGRGKIQLGAFTSFLAPRFFRALPHFFSEGQKSFVTRMIRRTIGSSFFLVQNLDGVRVVNASFGNFTAVRKSLVQWLTESRFGISKFGIPIKIRSLMSAGIGCNSLWVVIYCTQILFVILGTFSVL